MGNGLQNRIALCVTALFAGVLLVLTPGAFSARAELAAVTPLPPVTEDDGFAGVCYSHYDGPGDRRYFGLVRDIGVHHDRIDFRWDVIVRPEVGYEPYDSVVNDAAPYGIDIIAILMATPADRREPDCDVGGATDQVDIGASLMQPLGWYVPEAGRDQSQALLGSDPGACPPMNLGRSWSPTDFNGNYWAEYVYNTVVHFKGRIHSFEIWNEAEWPYFWLGSDAEYAQLLKVGYEAVKAADPDATVLFAGLHYWADPTFFERVLDILNDDSQAAANNYYFDVMSVHLYSRSSSAYDVVRDIRSKMSLYVPAHPIWLTETGVPVYDGQYPGPRGPYSATEAEQAAYLIQSYANARAAGVERYHWFRVHDDPGMPEHFGVTHDNTYLRPSYVAYQVATRYLLSPTLVTNWTYYSGVRRVSFWGTPWGKVSVLWNTLPTAQSFQHTAALPTATLVDRWGNTQVIAASNGEYTIPLPGATAYLTHEVGGPSDYYIGGDPYLVIESDTQPPAIAVEALPATTFSKTVMVAWEGTDDAAGIWGYDVQVKEGASGDWTDWLHLAPQAEVGYTDGVHSQMYCFRARAWDRAGNIGDWSDGTACTTLDFIRDVHIAVGSVVGESEGAGGGASTSLTLTNLTFRLLDAWGSDVIAPVVGDSLELTLPLEAGPYELVVTPETWGTPPPGWLPAWLSVEVQAGSGEQQIVWPVVTLAPHNYSYILPVVMAAHR